jgi:enamine deaminase RidA (YjgF/YER057c/UK114 family)
VSTPSERLAELGLTLPAVAKPLAAYVPAVRAAGLVYSSGQLPTVDGTLVATGTVGDDVSPEQAADCARVAALNALAAIAEEAGGLDAVERVVRIVVYVAAVDGFRGHPQVGNGASELVGALFGPAGAHARSAVGVATLPLGSPVEVEVVAEVAARPRIVPV